MNSENIVVELIATLSLRREVRVTLIWARKSPIYLRAGPVLILAVRASFAATLLTCADKIRCCFV